MLIIPSIFRKKFSNAKQLDAERTSHHAYGRELIADGFVSPIALAADRLQELRGDMDIPSFAVYTGLSEFELEFLLENEHMEPTGRQLMTISNKTGKSIVWLLGYHVPADAHMGNGDTEMVVAISKRNSIEEVYKKTSSNGIFNNFLRNHAAKRVGEANREVSITAARIVARLHHPLSAREVMWMKGQPVFIEFENRPPEDGLWGICTGRTILTAEGEFVLAEGKSIFRVYQTPKI